jgi:hypothetical protein
MRSVDEKVKRGCTQTSSRSPLLTNFTCLSNKKSALENNLHIALTKSSHCRGSKTYANFMDPVFTPLHIYNHPSAFGPQQEACNMYPQPKQHPPRDQQIRRFATSLESTEPRYPRRSTSRSHSHSQNSSGRCMRRFLHLQNQSITVSWM